SHLGDLERVRKAVAGEIETLGRAQNLGLGGEPAQGTRVQQTRTVAGKVAAARIVFLGQKTGRVMLAITLGGEIRLNHRWNPALLPRPRGSGRHSAPGYRASHPARRDASACPRVHEDPRHRHRDTAYPN